MCIGRDAGVSTRHKLNSSNVSTRSLRFLSYNGKGLVTKLDVPIFEKRFPEFEIVVVTETWRTNDSQVKHCELLGFLPNLTKTCSGYISMLVKHIIRPSTTVVENTEGFIWLKWCKSYCDFSSNLFVQHTYLLRILPMCYHEKKLF